MNIYCNNCDGIFTETTLFCPNCGTPTPFYYTQGEGSAGDSPILPTHPGIAPQKIDADYSTVPQEAGNSPILPPHPGGTQQKIDTTYSTVAQDIVEKNIYELHNPYSIIPPPPPPPRQRRSMSFIIGIATIAIIVPLLILSSVGVHDLLAQRAKPPSNNLTVQPTATTMPKIAVVTATPAMIFPASSVNLTSFSNDGYSIGYPDGWAVKKEGTVVQITPDNKISMLIETIESPAGVSTAGGVEGALSGFKATTKNFQLKTVASPITLDNTQWDQGAATADNSTTGESETVYVITAKFPGNANKVIVIIYGGGTSEFEKDNPETFQPMLQSFKFI